MSRDQERNVLAPVADWEVAGKMKIATGFGSWLTSKDEHSDVVISSRIRLARNLKERRFPNRASKDELERVVTLAWDACKKCPSLDRARYVSSANLPREEGQFFVERRLASPQFIDAEVPSMLVISPGETLSIMVNEEDHLRLQCLAEGLGIDKAWDYISKVDDELDSHLDFCYTREHGYLTACPTNLGTAMRVSIFVHLPALAWENKIDDVMKKFPENEIAIRGFYGEGTEIIGNIYQISNQLTLGRTEKGVIEQIYHTAQDLVMHERQARKSLMRNFRLSLDDAVGRAVGIIKYAQLISSFEAMNLLSTLRLGKELGILNGVKNVAYDQLMVLIQPAHLQKIYKHNFSADERDKVRADFLKHCLCSS